jgi:hypothetical protein
MIFMRTSPIMWPWALLVMLVGGLADALGADGVPPRVEPPA